MTACAKAWHRWPNVAHRQAYTLSLPVGDEPPREVRLFTPGANSTRKGTFLFDTKAAREVMAAAERHGVDVMIDLEHLSLDRDARNFDPDARGWGRLEMRGGELWLAGIKWTPEGEQRLRQRRQRYVSPAFDTDPKTDRVTRIFNVAITALPATDAPMPLIAASEARMDAKMIKEALEAIEAGDSAKALEILKGLIAAAAGAEEAGEPAAEMAEDEEPEAMMAEGEDEEEMLAEGDEDEDKQIAATARKLTGRRKASEVRAALSALSMSRGSASKLADVERRLLNAELRELVRQNPRKVAGPKIEKHVLSMPSVKDARVFLSVLPDALPETLSEPAREHDTEIKLTDADRQVCRLTGTPPEKFLAAKKAQAAKGEAR